MKSNLFSFLSKRLTSLGVFLLIPILVFSENNNQGLDDQINSLVEPITSFIYEIVFYPWVYNSPENDTKMPFVIILLLVAATIFTFYFKFINAN